MAHLLFRINQDKIELLKKNVTVTGIAVMTTKFLSGMCDFMVNSHGGKGGFSLVLGFCTCLSRHGLYQSSCLHQSILIILLKIT